METSAKISSQCITWDFTAFNFKTHLDIVELLKPLCKAWDFQLETCPTTGKDHYQGRVKLKEKLRLSALIKKFPEGHFHWSPTSKAHINDVYYVTKEESRKDGPWSSDDPEIFIPKQYKFTEEQLYPFQKSILDSKKYPDDRKINIIIDSHGNSGKSTIVGYMDCRNLATKIPFCKDYKDIMRMCYGLPTSSMYFFDIPRSLKSESVVNLFAGIEELKNGYCFDDRYSYKVKRMDSPIIWVFANSVPPPELLSSDRWNYYQIKNRELVKFNPIIIDPMTKESKMAVPQKESDFEDMTVKK